MFKNWTNRDWLWLLGVLISIIILLIGSVFARSKNIEVNFGIVSSAVSIALALLAIFFAWKQDSDNQVVTRETSKLLSIITTKIENMDNKIDRLDPKVVTTPVENQLKGEIENIINEKENELNHELISKINYAINEKFNTINNQLEGYINNKKTRNCKIELIPPVTEEQIDKFTINILKNIKTNGIAYSIESDKHTVTFSTDNYNLDLLDVLPKLALQNGLKIKSLQII